MGRMVSATEARIHFGELMRKAVENGEPIIVERGGKSTVVLLSFEEYERLVKGQQAQVDWKALVAEARAQARADLGDRALPPPEEILRQIREERDEQLLAVR
jgi:prevent-host-death family protein